MRYYGCKTKLLDYIEDAVRSLHLRRGAIFFDIFSGTASVGKHFKKLGYTVYSNDFLEFAHALAQCYIKINKKPSFKILQKEGIDNVIGYLNKLKGKAGFITKNYSPYKTNKRQYLSVANAQRIDAIREKIHYWKERGEINQDEYYYLITSVIEAINLVSNVTGTYAAFLKSWDRRALKPLKLNHPEIIISSFKNKAFKKDANRLVSQYAVDVLYLDPPYNSRQFAANYFFLELIAEGWFDGKPAIYGESGMRPYDHQKSVYSMKNGAEHALSGLVQKARAKYILLSYNNEGIISHEKIKRILGARGNVKEFVKEHKRYRAINQDGTNTKTNESLFILEVKH